MMYTPNLGEDALSFGNVTGSGTSGSGGPYVYQAEVEFTSADVSQFFLPSLTDTIACYVLIDNRVDFDFRDPNDLSNPSSFELFTMPGTPSDDPANESTSRAVKLSGLDIILLLIGVMSFYF